MSLKILRCDPHASIESQDRNAVMRSREPKSLAAASVQTSRAVERALRRVCKVGHVVIKRVQAESGRVLYISLDHIHQRENMVPIPRASLNFAHTLSVRCSG
jgi:hypothetical protein